MIKFNDYKKCLLNDEVMFKPQEKNTIHKKKTRCLY